MVSPQAGGAVMSYSGYLSPYMRDIRRRMERGDSNRAIAVFLYESKAVRSPYLERKQREAATWGGKWYVEDQLRSIQGLLGHFRRQDNKADEAVAPTSPPRDADGLLLWPEYDDRYYDPYPPA
jgi:hypothetical protein